MPLQLCHVSRLRLGSCPVSHPTSITYAIPYKQQRTPLMRRSDHVPQL